MAAWPQNNAGLDQNCRLDYLPSVIRPLGRTLRLRPTLSPSLTLLQRAEVIIALGTDVTAHPRTDPSGRNRGIPLPPWAPDPRTEILRYAEAVCHATMLITESA